MEEASDVHLRDKETKIFILQGLLIISPGLYLENVNFSDFWLVPCRGWVPQGQQTLGVRSYRRAQDDWWREESTEQAQLSYTWPGVLLPNWQGLTCFSFITFSLSMCHSTQFSYMDTQQKLRQTCSLPIWFLHSSIKNIKFSLKL